MKRFHCSSCQLEREMERAWLEVGFEALASVCQQRGSLADISFPLLCFQASSQWREAGEGMSTAPEGCVLERALTLAIIHTY